MSDQQILIVGTGRSGTSILKKILNHHSQIYTYPKELRFMADEDGIVELRHSLTAQWNPHNASKAIERFVELMTSQLFETKLHDKVLNRVLKRVFSGSGAKYGTVRMGDFISRQHLRKCIETFLRDLKVERISGYWYGSNSFQKSPEMYYTRSLQTQKFDEHAGIFIDRLLSYPLNRNGTSNWCDDTPMNILNAGTLSMMLNNIKILHIYRNPLDVVASYTDPKQAWAPADPEYAAGWVKEILTKWISIRSNISTQNYLEVKYEELISKQEEGLDKIMDFLGLEFEDNLLNLRLNASSVGRYKSDFSTTEIKDIKSILNPFLEEYGYTDNT